MHSLLNSYQANTDLCNWLSQNWMDNQILSIQTVQALHLWSEQPVTMHPAHALILYTLNTPQYWWTTVLLVKTVVN